MIKKNNTFVKGWMVYEMGGNGGAENSFFLDLNNAMACCERKRPGVTLMIQPQYMPLEQAADLHKSRLRQTRCGYER